jgi:hypothetical protein
MFNIVGIMVIWDSGQECWNGSDSVRGKDIGGRNRNSRGRKITIHGSGALAIPNIDSLGADFGDSSIRSRERRLLGLSSCRLAEQVQRHPLGGRGSTTS